MLSSKFVMTLASVHQLSTLIRGSFLKGYAAPRIAVVGRSNVGKSSLINQLLKNHLAQVSRHPGKTKAIHFYLWRSPLMTKMIADLPGYGYARVSHAEKNHWQELILAYLRADPCLEQIIILMDVQVGVTKFDRQALEFLRGLKIPVVGVFTKFDLLKTQSMRMLHLKKVLDLYYQLMGDQLIFCVSSRTKQGLSALRDYLLKSH